MNCLFSFLILVIWVFSVFFLVSLAKVCPFFCSFQGTNVWSCWLYYFSLIFIILGSNLHYFVISVYFTFSLLFFEFLEVEFRELIFNRGIYSYNFTRWVGCIQLSFGMLFCFSPISKNFLVSFVIYWSIGQRV